jgi:O-antigen/teichoic acid export membrane protein
MEKNKYLKGAFYLSTATIVFMLSGYLINIILGRFLGPELYGVYGVIISLMTALNIVQLSGPPQAVSKFIAEKKTSAENILASGLQVQLITTIIIALMFFILAPLISNLFNDSNFTGYCRAAALIFPFYGLFALFSGYYNGLHKFKFQAYMYVLYSLSKLLLVVILTIKFGIYGAIAGFVIAPIISLILGLRRPHTKRVTYKKKIILYSMPLIGVAIFTTLQLSIDLFSLKAIVSSTAVVGYYVVSQNIALIPYMAMNAIGQVLFPSVSKFLGAGQIDDVRNIIGQSLRYLLIFLLPMTAALYATAPSLIHLLFGIKYMPAVVPLRILLVSYVLLAIFSMLANVLNGAGEAQSTMRIAAAGLLTCFFGCIMLIPHLGANGAAFGALIGASISSSLSSITTYKIFRFNFSYKSLMNALLGSIIILTIAMLMPFPIALLPLEYILLAIAYLLTLHTMGEITLEDKTHIKNLLPAWLPLNRWL